MKVHAVMILWSLILQVAVAAKIKRTDPNVFGKQASTFEKPKSTAFEPGHEYTLNGTDFKMANSSAWIDMHNLNNHTDGSCGGGTLHGDECIEAGTDRNAWRYRKDWPNGIIPYTFDHGFPKSEIPKVKKAMQSWMSNTPVVFEDITGDPVRLKSTHVLITSQYGGCWSYLGKTTLIQQPMNLQHSPPYGTCIWPPIIIHELGHVIGLHHTHQRSDRDAHVKIIEKNVYPPYLDQFNLADTDNFNVAYNYESIMHYTRTAFSMSELSATIYAKGHPGDKETWLGPLQFDMGNVDDAAHEDYAVVNAMYNASCDCPFKPCFNGGYIAQNCTCICPPNYKGNACETKTGRRYEPRSKYWNKCGPSFVNKTTVIQSYNYPNAHCEDTTCEWYLLPPQKGYRTVIHFTEFHLYPNPWIDYLDVYSENLYTGKKYTGCELHGETIKSENPVGVMLRWRTGYICGATGFQAKVTFEKILFPCKLWKSISVRDCERCQMNRRRKKSYCKYFQDCLCEPEPCDDDKKEDDDEEDDEDEEDPER